MLTETGPKLLLGLIMVLAASAHGAAPTATAPATRPAERPWTEKRRLSIPGSESASWYLLRHPAGHGPTDRPALLIVLHGTDDTAQDMIDFWSRRLTPIPLLIAAPQGIGKGWRRGDVQALRAMLDDLHQNIPHDADRVMLAGFSAGGSMAMHLVYAEGLSFAGVAALANYVPPRLTEEQIRARRHVPVFYAVGIKDVNAGRMQIGLDLLRTCGANVDLYRPQIGHVLDSSVAQAALDWLMDRCDRRVTEIIQTARGAEDRAAAAIRLEGLIAQSAWHASAHVDASRRALAEIESSGRADLAAAERAVRTGDPLTALDILAKVEATYGQSALGRQARQRRETLENTNDLGRRWRERNELRRQAEALAQYAVAQRLVAENRFDAARLQCEEILIRYADTPAADRARYLRDLLDARGVK